MTACLEALSAVCEGGVHKGGESWETTLDGGEKEAARLTEKRNLSLQRVTDRSVEH